MFAKLSLSAVALLFVTSCQTTEESRSNSSPERNTKSQSLMSVGDTDYKVRLPEGYCDFSDTAWGMIVHDRLVKLSAANVREAAPKIIFRRCGASINGGLPWGYIGILPKTPYINSQISLNKGLAQIFDNGPAMKKLMAENFAKSKPVASDSGYEMSDMVSGKPYLVLADENTIVFTIMADLKINNQDHKERVVQAVTVLPDFTVRYSLYDNGASKFDGLTYAQHISTSAEHLKSQMH